MVDADRGPYILATRIATGFISGRLRNRNIVKQIHPSSRSLADISRESKLLNSLLYYSVNEEGTQNTVGYSIASNVCDQTTRRFTPSLPISKINEILMTTTSKDIDNLNSKIKLMSPNKTPWGFLAGCLVLSHNQAFLNSQEWLNLTEKIAFLSETYVNKWEKWKEYAISNLWEYKAEEHSRILHKMAIYNKENLKNLSPPTILVYRNKFVTVVTRRDTMWTINVPRL